MTAALVTGVLLGTITVFFVRTVQRQLWQQSMASIMESTQQGRNTLQIQLRGEYEVMGTVASHLREYAGTQAAELDEYLRNYSEVDTGILLYLENTACYPDDMGMDENLTEILEKNDQKQGIIAPHISSATGVNVFNLFVQVTLKDGTKGYLIKEYEVDRIVDTFTVSFYQDTGFSYVLDTNGNILIRPPHPNSNKTVQNLFDMLQVPENSQTGLERFTQSLREGKTGWATFTYQEENTVFCYIPLKLDTDWYLVSIIPSAVVNKQTSQIIMRTFTLIGCIILGIALLVLLYFRYVNRANHRLRNQAEYISHLYNAVPEGILLTTSEEPYRFLQVNDEGSAFWDFRKDHRTTPWKVRVFAVWHIRRIMKERCSCFRIRHGMGIRTFLKSGSEKRMILTFGRPELWKKLWIKMVIQCSSLPFTILPRKSWRKKRLSAGICRSV